MTSLGRGELNKTSTMPLLFRLVVFASWVAALALAVVAIWSRDWILALFYVVFIVFYVWLYVVSQRDSQPTLVAKAGLLVFSAAVFILAMLLFVPDILRRIAG